MSEPKLEVPAELLDLAPSKRQPVEVDDAAVLQDDERQLHQGGKLVNQH